MTRQELRNLRVQVLEEYKKRVALGGFDVNAEAITLCLHAITELIQHSMDMLPKKDANR
jgi:hypothetical protein